MLVDPYLDAAAVDVGSAVDPRREIDPCRHVRGGKPAIAGGCAEVDDDLPRRPNTPPQQLRKEARQPRTAREHKAVACNLRTALRSQRAQRQRGPDPPSPGFGAVRATISVVGRPFRGADARRQQTHTSLLEISHKRSNGSPCR